MFYVCHCFIFRYVVESSLLMAITYVSSRTKRGKRYFGLTHALETETGVHRHKSIFELYFGLNTRGSHALCSNVTLGEVDSKRNKNSKDG